MGGDMIPGRILRLVSLLVPADRREEWLAEWQAEFRSNWGKGARQSRLPIMQYARCLGALEDAFWLRMRSRNGGMLLHDFRYAARTLRRNLGFTAVVILTLALGVGANTAIFSVVSGVLLQPLPYGDPDQLVTVWENNRSHSNHMGQVSPPNFADWREQNDGFSAMSAGYWWSATITGGAGAERVLGAAITPGTLQGVLGVSPSRGRSFLPEDGTEGAEPVVVLSHALWQRRFGSDPSVVGATVEISGVSRTVVGIMPAGFAVPTYPTAELWRPVTMDTYGDDRSSHYLRVIARLEASTTVEQAQVEMDAIMARLEQQYPEHNANTGANVVTLKHYVVRQVDRALYVLLGAVGFVLLIACTNVANVMLARASVREREFAVRSALGAGRRRLIRQVMTESMLLAALGGAAGLLLAHWGVRLLIAMSPPGIPRLDQVGIDPRVLVFMLSVTVVTGLAFGIVPALQVSRRHGVDALREGGRGASAGRAGVRARKALVVAQLAIALVLLGGAGLLTRSFGKLISEQIGFDATGVVVAPISLAGRYSDDADRAQFVNDLLERLGQRPEATAVGAAACVPFVPWELNSSFTIAGQPPPQPNEEPDARINPASQSYLQTVGIPLLRGRGFTDNDGPGSPGAAIINEVAQRQYWSGEDPLGQWIELEGWGPRRFEIVGIAGDARFWGFGSEASPEIYIPYDQQPFQFVNVVARVPRGAEQFIPVIREVIHELDPDIPVYDAATMRQLIGRSVASERFYMVLLVVFAIVAAAVAAVGIYGLLSYNVAMRSNEIGVRVALGAPRGDVLWQVVWDGCRLAVLGIGVGLAASLGLGRILTPLLHEVAATDPLNLLVTGLATALIAVLGSYVPARRATRVDPLRVLRAE
jgi:putative ABC transport system permease protein